MAGITLRHNVSYRKGWLLHFSYLVLLVDSDLVVQTQRLFTCVIGCCDNNLMTRYYTWSQYTVIVLFKNNGTLK